MSKPEVRRCPWCGDDPLYQEYHDLEWGRPLHDDQRLFEMLILEGAQAGLSWITVLRKRDNYRAAFDGFDVKKVAAYKPAKIDKLMTDAGIVRNRLKIEASIKNARAFLQIQKEFGSFDEYLWGYVGGKPIRNEWTQMGQIPPKTDLSDSISKDLKKRGMSFVGSTIIYAYLQAVGLVDDHLTNCHRYRKRRGAQS